MFQAGWRAFPVEANARRHYAAEPVLNAEKRPPAGDRLRSMPISLSHARNEDRPPVRLGNTEGLNQCAIQRQDQRSPHVDFKGVNMRMAVFFGEARARRNREKFHLKGSLSVEHQGPHWPIIVDRRRRKTHQGLLQDPVRKMREDVKSHREDPP